MLAALSGGLLKDDGSQVTIQAQTDSGIVELLACDYRGGDCAAMSSSIRNGSRNWVPTFHWKRCSAKASSR